MRYHLCQIDLSLIEKERNWTILTFRPSFRDVGDLGAAYPVDEIKWPLSFSRAHSLSLRSLPFSLSLSLFLHFCDHPFGRWQVGC